MAIRNIETQRKEEVLKFQNEDILTIRLEYPKVVSDASSRALDGINAFYEQMVQKLLRYSEDVLYPMQKDMFENQQTLDVPFRPAELYLTYDVTYHEGCFLSLIMDQYEYLGGAHGTTLRTAQTWNTDTGRQIPLVSLFASPRSYRETVIDMVKQQITQEIERGEDKYYRECLLDVGHTFKEDRFYLTDQGVIVFFQQYEIAPYASGIPEFLLPYTSEIRLPPCQ